MTYLEHYVEQVLKHIQSPADEREDIREELLSHLKESKRYYTDCGYSEKEAEKKAVAEFGYAEDIGGQLQASMYPFQRGLIYTVGIASLICGMVFNLIMGVFARPLEKVYFKIVKLLT